MHMLQSVAVPTPARRPESPRVNTALASFLDGAGWSSPSPQAYSALDAVGAAATQLRRTASAGRPVTPMLDGWREAPARSPRSSLTATSSDASASPPPSLQAECVALRDASLSDEAPDARSVEVLREQLRRMELRLAESECTASSLSRELGSRDEDHSASLAHLQTEHAYAMQALESSLRAEAQDALDAAATELEAAASERAHLWSLLRDAGKLADGAVPIPAPHSRRPPAGHMMSARVAAWATP